MFKNEFSPYLKWIVCDPSPHKMLQEHDAALIIGDPALSFNKKGATIIFAPHSQEIVRLGNHRVINLNRGKIVAP